MQEGIPIWPIPLRRDFSPRDALARFVESKAGDAECVEALAEAARARESILADRSGRFDLARTYGAARDRRRVLSQLSADDAAATAHMNVDAHGRRVLRRSGAVATFVHDTRSPAAPPSPGLSRRIVPSADDDARIIPSESPNFIWRGLRLAITTTRCPTSG